MLFDRTDDSLDTHDTARGSREVVALILTDGDREFDRFSSHGERIIDIFALRVDFREMPAR